MNIEVKIRKATSDDIDMIRQVHTEAFPSPLEARLVDVLRENGKATISLVAEVDDEVVGHILFSPVNIDPPVKSLNGLGLAPVAVLPRFQSIGIGGMLIRDGLATAFGAAFDFVVVLGDPKYYHRFGFATASSFGLENEYGVDEPFMVQELTPGCLKGVSGVIKYQPEFGMFEE